MRHSLEEKRMKKKLELNTRAEGLAPIEVLFIILVRKKMKEEKNKIRELKHKEWE